MPGVSFGDFPRSRPLALATFIPSRVRARMRSASNSATIASTLNNSFPIGSVGSYTDPAMLSFTSRAARSSAIWWAPRTERASRSSLVTTNVSPSRQAASACRRPSRSALRPVSPCDVDALGIDTERRESVTLRGQVLLVGGDSGIADLQGGHAPQRVI